MKKKKANNPTEKGAKDGNKKLIEKEMRIALTRGSQNLSHKENCNLNYTDTHTKLVQNLLTALFQRVRNERPPGICQERMGKHAAVSRPDSGVRLANKMELTTATPGSVSTLLRKSRRHGRRHTAISFM